MRSTASIIVSLLLLVVGAADIATAQSFMGLGDLAGGDFESFAAGISADGRFVTGRSVSAVDGEAFLWSEGTGMVGLGVPLNSDSSRGSAISENGGTVIGTHFLPGTARAFEWSVGNGIDDFDPFPVGAVDLFANDIDDDANTIVGSYRPGAFESNIAYHWQEGTLTPISASGRANAVSGDGSVVAGTNLVNPNGPLPLIDEAFVWTAANGNLGLGYLPGGSLDSGANGISADGLVLVGSSDSSNGSSEAFRWTLGDGMTGLGDLPGGDFNSSASDASADGSLIVGRGMTANGSTPFIWDASNGMRNLTEFLINDFGLGDQLAGWDLGGAEAISDDGTVIIGNGINPDGNSEAWRAVLVPEPSTPLLSVLGSMGFLLCRRRAGVI